MAASSRSPFTMFSSSPSVGHVLLVWIRRKVVATIGAIVGVPLLFVLTDISLPMYYNISLNICFLISLSFESWYFKFFFICFLFWHSECSIDRTELHVFSLWISINVNPAISLKRESFSNICLSATLLLLLAYRACGAFRLPFLTFMPFQWSAACRIIKLLLCLLLVMG